jgi:hypothetical protein
MSFETILMTEDSFASTQCTGFILKQRFRLEVSGMMDSPGLRNNIHHRAYLEKNSSSGLVLHIDNTLYIEL